MAGSAMLIGIFMILVARPLSVFACLLPFRKMSGKARVFVSWVGLRGAVPIIFATYPVVANIPGAVPRTSTLALTNATLPYVLQLADKGWQQACREDPALALGLNIVNGEITYKAVADVWQMPYTPLTL